MLITRFYLLQNASTCESLELKSLWIQVSWSKKNSKTHIQIPHWHYGQQIKTKKNIAVHVNVLIEAASTYYVFFKSVW